MSIPGFDMNSGEFFIIVIIALVLIGPKRLPEYAAKLRTWVKQMRDMAEGAKTQLKSEMGPEFEDVDWRQYDPRQYDPRKIVREALFDDPDADIGAELGLTERRADGGPSTGATAVGAMGVGAVGAGVGADVMGPGVGSESAGVGHESFGVGAEGDHVTSQPAAPRSHVDATYHPDRATPFDHEAT